MALNVGELQATLGLDARKFSTGIDKATNQIQGLGDTVNQSMNQAENATQNLDQATDDLSRSAEELTKTLKTTENQTAGLSTAVNNVSASLDDAGDSASRTASDIDKTGDAAKESSGFIDTLKGVLGGLGIGFSVEAIIQGLKKIGEMALQAANDYDDAMRDISIRTASTADAELYAGLAGSLAGKSGYSTQDMMQAMAALGKANPALKENDDLMKKMTVLYLNFADTMNTDVVSAISDTNVVFKKWGITLDQQQGYLDYFKNTAGQNNVELEDLIELLGDGDRAFSLMGKSAMEAADYIAAVGNEKGTVDDVRTLISSVEKLATLYADSFGSDSEAEKAITNALKMSSACSDQTEAITLLNQALPGASHQVDSISKVFDVSAVSVEEAKNRTAEADLALQSYVKSTEQLATDGQENINKFFASTGQGMQDLTNSYTNLVGILAQSGLDFRSLSSLWLNSAAAIVPQMRLSTQLLNTAGITESPINIIQNFNVPTADQYDVYQATQQAAREIVKR